MTTALAHSPPFGRAAAGRFEPDPATPPAIDLVHLARQTFGEKRLETELLRMFSVQARQIVASLAAPTDGAEIAKGRASADLLHMLVGSARVIGAFAVAETAERLELSLRAGDGSTEFDTTDVARAVETACAFVGLLLGPI